MRGDVLGEFFAGDAPFVAGCLGVLNRGIDCVLRRVDSGLGLICGYLRGLHRLFRRVNALLLLSSNHRSVFAVRPCDLLQLSSPSLGPVHRWQA